MSSRRESVRLSDRAIRHLARHLRADGLGGDCEDVLLLRQRLQLWPDLVRRRDDLRLRLLRDALRAVCDGTYGEDTSRWTLEVGPETGMDVETLVDALARRLHPGIPSLVPDRDGELPGGPARP